VPESPSSAPTAVAEPPTVELAQLQEAWARTIVPAVAEKSIPISSVFGQARPAQLAGDTLTVEFPASNAFQRQLAEDPKNATLLRDALYEVTGRKLAVAFEVGEGEAPTGEAEAEGPAGEEQILELMKETLGAREREDRGE
jgi:hypothetical protein